VSGSGFRASDPRLRVGDLVGKEFQIKLSGDEVDCRVTSQHGPYKKKSRICAVNLLARKF
jgi:hypothetical protein